MADNKETGPIEAGNIDLHNRPVVRNDNGSISTVRSMSFGEDGVEILVPTVGDEGRILSEEEAIDRYRQTGKHLGKFRTPEEATAYAKQLHTQQEDEYAPKSANTVTAPVISDDVQPGDMDFDPLGDTTNVLAVDEESVPIEVGAAQQVADLYNMAGVDKLQKPLSVAEVVNQFSSQGDVSGSDISYLMSAIDEEDAGVQRDLMVAAISNPRVGVEQRLQLAEQLNGFNSGYDLNAVPRQAMHNANVMENSGDTDEDIEAREAGALEADFVPKNLQLEAPMPTPEDVQREEYYSLLNDAFTTAEEDSGGRDFLGTMIPFRYQAPVMRIYNALGLNQGDAVNSVSGNLLMGDALKQIREKVDGMGYEEKKEALDTVLKILKPNSGVFSDGNDFVTTHTLEQIFYRDLYGKSPEQEQGSVQVQRYTEELARYKAGGASDALIADTEAKLAMAKKQAATGAGGTSGIMDNFGSLLDLSMIGGLARSTLRLGTKWMPKSLMRLRKVAPDMATRTAVDAMDNEAIRLKFPYLGKEDVALASLPASDKAIQEGGVEGIGELITRQLDIRDHMLRISGRSNMTAAERADAFVEIQKLYGDVAAKPTSTLHINESIFTQGPAEATVEAIFGRTKTKAFSSLNQARKASIAEIEQTFGKDANVEVVWRNPATGKLESVPEGMAGPTKGEFFLSAKDARAYESAPTTFHSLIFGDKDVANLAFAPSLWKHLRGPSLFSKETMDNVRVAIRQRAEWNKLTAGLFTDVAALGRGEQRLLSTVLKDGEKATAATGRGTIYAPSELRAKGLSEKGVKAYYAYRNATDIMFQVTNRQTRTQMLREGLKDIHGPAGRVGFAQPLGQAAAAADSVLTYDALKNAFVTLSRKEVDDLYKAGKQLGKLEQPMLGKGGAEATHVIISESEGVKALGLPRRVMNKMEGYYPHMWNGNYVVYGVTKSGGRYALGLASNETEARAVTERMMRVNTRRAAQGKTNRFSEIKFDFDRQLSQDLGRRGKIQSGLYHNMGGPVYGHRNGGALRNFSKASGDILVDPIEAMLRGMEIVGSKTTKGDLATYMRQKLYQYAKSNGLLKDSTLLPQTVEDLVKTADKSVEYNKAVAYLGNIDNMLNMRDSVDEVVSAFYLNASEFMSRYLGKTTFGKALSTRLANKAARGGDPMSAVMGLSHRRYIASSPAAQLALQASQSLMMLGVAPMQYAKSVAQSTAISMLVGMRTAGLHGGKLLGQTREQFLQEAKSVSKILGMGEDELVNVVDTIMDSGIVSSVGYHAQMRQAMRSAAEERMMAGARTLNRTGVGTAVGQFARAADAATFGNLSRIGFEAGESINQIVTFLTLYNRDKVKGVANLADPDYVKSLVGSVAEMTGDMMAETGFSYQRGWLKAAFQFVSFQHKMLLMMLPEFVGGAKSVTSGEKAGMMLGQFLMFGRRGAPHMDALYRVVDSKIRDSASDDKEANELYAAWNDPSTKAVMDGLLFDTLGNAVIKDLFGEDQPNYGLSAKFAPGGGSEFMMDRLWALATNPTKTFFGLGGEALGVQDVVMDATGYSMGNSKSNLYRFFKRVGNVTLANLRDLDDVPLDERAEELAKSGGIQLASTYNRYLAVQAAERMDGYVSSGGRVSEGFSGPLEGILYTGFGIMTKDRESLYEAMDKYQEDMSTNAGKKQKELDTIASQYWQDLVMTAVKFDKEATSDEVWGTLMDKAVRERGLLFSMLDPEDAEYIRDKIEDRVNTVLKNPNESAETAFIERMQKDIQKGGFGSTGPDVALYLSEAEFVRNNPKLAEIVRQSYVEATNDDYLEMK